MPINSSVKEGNLIRSIRLFIAASIIGHCGSFAKILEKKRSRENMTDTFLDNGPLLQFRHLLGRLWICRADGTRRIMTL